MKNINLNNINVNNTKSHLEALLKQREELAKKLAALDAEIKETKKLLATKEQVLKLQAEYAAKVAALKKEYDAKMQALIGEDITPDPQPESPKPAPKAQVKETAAPKAAPVAKKAEEKKPAQTPAAKAEAKPIEAPKAAPAPSEKKETVKTHNKSQFLREIAVDNFQKVINEIPKEEAADVILHAQINGTKEQLATLGNAVIYGYQNGIRKFWFTYSTPELLNAVSEEMGEVLKAAALYGFTVKVTQRVVAPKAQAAQNVAALAASSAKADRTQAAAPKQEAPADNPDAFRAWTLCNATPVDGDDEI